MAKEWFQHDYGTRNKKKLAVLIHEEGMKGYGLFWVIVEMLYEDRRKKMELDQSTYLAIKKESGAEVSEVIEFINKCIGVYKVFKMIGKSCFTTQRVLENEKFRRNISRQNSEHGRKGGKSKSNNVALAKRPLEESKRSSSKGEEMRGDESTGKERESTAEREIPEAVSTVPIVVPDARAPDLLISNLNRKPVIPTKNQIWEFFVSAGGTKEMAKAFFEKHDATGWFIDGSPIVNFRSLANKFIDTWKRNDEEKNKKETGPVHTISTGGPKLEKLQ